MTAQRRAFDHDHDLTAFTEYLTGLYRPSNADGNWFAPIWEYACTHGIFDHMSVNRIGVWEDDGRIVAVVTYELRLGEAFFNVASGYDHLRAEMLDHAEAHLVNAKGDPLRVYVPQWHEQFEQLLASRGYHRLGKGDRPMSSFEIPDQFPTIPLAEGFRLSSLAEDNDLRRLDRLMHRGFNHEGEPPADGPEGRKQMQSGPHFRKDINVVVVAPNGDYASFGGMWFDEVNRFGYVEPVCTDPGYRRLGLGRAAVLESIRRVGTLGATVAYVGTEMPFYLSFGFEPTAARQNCWVSH